MKKTVALIAGSFNPPHEGHFEMASFIHKTLDVDETWMLFSENPEKDPSVYPSLEHRLNMGALMAKHYDAPLILSSEEADIAEKIGRHETYYVLKELEQRFPDNQFIWVMGADTFSNFHRWKERSDILSQHIVAVVNRPGYKEQALTSCTATEFAHSRIDIEQHPDLHTIQSGWCFLDNPEFDVSSSGIVQKFAEGFTDFTGPFAEVAEYVYEHGLYGTHKPIQSNPLHARILP